MVENNISQIDMMQKCRGVFAGAGSDGMNEQFICNQILTMSGKDKPSVLYLGVATYDLPGPCARQTAYFEKLGCQIDTLKFAGDQSTWPQDMQAKVDTADVIIASGGNTIFAIDRFVNSGFKPILQNAMIQGKVFCGGSFGAIWVFDAGHSDSMDPDTYKDAMTGTLSKGGDESTNLEGEAKKWDYVRVPCLSFLPGLCCPHYDKVQSNGVLRAVDFEGMMLRHSGEIGFGIDHWAAISVEEGNYEVLSTPGKPGSVNTDGTFSPEQKGVPGVWKLTVEDGKVIRTLAPEQGKLSDLVQPAKEIVLDTRVDISRKENP